MNKKSTNSIPKYSAANYKISSTLAKIVAIVLVLFGLIFFPIGFIITLIIAIPLWLLSHAWAKTAKEITNAEINKENRLAAKKQNYINQIPKSTVTSTHKPYEDVVPKATSPEHATIPTASHINSISEPLDRYEKAREARRLYNESLRAIDKSKILCLDLETTGLEPDNDEILQLSIIDGNGNILFNEYIKPTSRKRWPKAQEKHGISYQMVKDNPTIDHFKPTINQIIENAELIVGYNIEKFDMNFLLAAGIIVPKNIKIYDVMLKFAPIYGKWNDYHGEYTWQKLETCAKYYGYKKSGDFHNSLEDAKATLHCYFKMIATA